MKKNNVKCLQIFGSNLNCNQTNSHKRSAKLHVSSQRLHIEALFIYTLFV